MSALAATALSTHAVIRTIRATRGYGADLALACIAALAAASVIKEMRRNKRE